MKPGSAHTQPLALAMKPQRREEHRPAEPETRNPKSEIRNKSKLMGMPEQERGNRSIWSQAANNFGYCSAEELCFVPFFSALFASLR